MSLFEKKRVVSGMVVAATLLTLTGCKMFNELLIQTSVRPQEIREYKPKGVLVFGCVEVSKKNEGSVTGAMFYFDGAPNLNMPIKQEGGFETFLIDVPSDCGYLERIGVRYSLEGNSVTQMFLNRYKIVLASNEVIIVSNNNDYSIIQTMQDGKYTVQTNWGNVGTNQYSVINYIGRFIIDWDDRDLFRGKFNLRVTNMFTYDRGMLLVKYPSLSNIIYNLVNLKEAE